MNKKRPISAFSVIVAFLCAALIGAALLPLLPIKLAPSNTMQNLSVSFSATGSARTIEMEITSKLEAMFARAKGLREIGSTSGNNWGNIWMNFDKHIDIEMARFEISSIIRQAWPQLPQGTSYPRISTRRSDEQANAPFMVYTLNAVVSPIALQNYAEEVLKPNLAAIRGIDEIQVSGATPMEWHLSFDSDQLARLGIAPEQIQTAIDEAFKSQSLGLCRIEGSANNHRWIRLALEPSAEEHSDLGSVLIQNKEGRLLRLDQLVSITYCEKEPSSYFRINGLNSIYLRITAEEQANQIRVAGKVKACIEELQKSLPQGYEMHLQSDASERISKELNKIYFRTSLTIAILLLFVLLIARNLRYLLLIILSLSFNLLIAVILYYFFEVELQFYSLAGITISLSLIIDNTIVMTDHLLRRQNRGIFLPILAATLTTIGALSFLFFLDEEVRLNLLDFALVVSLNLAVSLLVALFLVPALVEKLRISKPKKKRGIRIFNSKPWLRAIAGKRKIVYLNRAYWGLISLLRRRRWIPLTALVLAFGIPLFLAPAKIEGEGRWASLYNRLFDSATYKEKVKPIAEKALGGTLRPFIQKIKSGGGGFSRQEREVVLSISASLPNGYTLEQMNTLIRRMESYLSEFKEIRQFQSNVSSGQRASINVYFKQAYERGSFPYELKSKVIAQALQLGGGSWSVYGLEDQGFNNSVHEQNGNYRIKITGYNYDDLYAYADTLRQRLLTNRRIKEVTIDSEFSWYKKDYSEFFFRLDPERMAETEITPYQLFAGVTPSFLHNFSIGNVLLNNESQQITLSAIQREEIDTWGVQHLPVILSDKTGKLSHLAQIEKRQTPQNIGKWNQQYTLCLQYEYIGSYTVGQRVQKQAVEKLNEVLPMGYKANIEGNAWGWWNKEDYKPIYLLLLVILIIFFTTSILFNSLRQPFAIIFVIPISYIGVFLTFSLFSITFDQGGFAAFVLLCGITVNASIYILNEYNTIRNRYRQIDPYRAYIKAWNLKIIPIFLTIVSTILGFTPFLVGTGKEAFWYPMAAGTIGGLIMSVVGIYLFLPLFIKLPKIRKENRRRCA